MEYIHTVDTHTPSDKATQAQGQASPVDLLCHRLYVKLSVEELSSLLIFMSIGLLAISQSARQQLWVDVRYDHLSND